MKNPLIKFKEQGKDLYYCHNHEKEFLGTINKARVGKFMHWIFSPQEQTFFTNGCLKEIIEFITNLYRKERKENKNV